MSLCLARRALWAASIRTALPRRPILSISRGLETDEYSSVAQETLSPAKPPSVPKSRSSETKLETLSAARDSISSGIGTKDEDLEYYEDILEGDFEDDDTAGAGHLMLRQQRQVLYYLRLIEHEMPKLVGNLFPFVSYLRLTRDKQHTGNHLSPLRRVMRLWSSVRWTTPERSIPSPPSAPSLPRSMICR